MKLNYRLVAKSLNSIDPTANVLKTPVDPKHIILQDRGDGEVQAVFLEPVWDLKYRVNIVFESFAMVFFVIAAGAFLTYGALFMLAGLGLISLEGI